MLRAFFLAAAVVVAQETYDDYPDYYPGDYGTEAASAATSARPFTTTGEPATTQAAPTEAPEILNDFVATTQAAAEEEQEEDLDGFGRSFNPFGQARTEPVDVNDINNLTGELLAGGDFKLIWERDATHTGVFFDYVKVIGNHQNTTDWVEIDPLSITIVTETIDNVEYSTTTITPWATNSVFTIRLLPSMGDAPNENAEYASITMQSSTDTLTHEPGDIYEGGSGFVGQVLLITDFTDASYMKTDAADTEGRVTVVKIDFPAGCTGSFRVDADVDGTYIYTDDNIATPHRIFVFPHAHFSNQFAGPLKSFHYYVSGMNGCITDPENDVTYVTDLSYVTRVTDAVDGASSPSNITVSAMWPSDGAYPPVQYTEQHVVWFDTVIQQMTHLGPSVALAPPRINFQTGVCDVLINIAEEVGYSPGWGYLPTYDSNLAMTDLFSVPGTTNLGSSFNFQALEWLNHIGISFRYDTSDPNCLIISSSGSITYLKMDPSFTLSTATNPDQNG